MSIKLVIYDKKSDLLKYKNTLVDTDTSSYVFRSIRELLEIGQGYDGTVLREIVLLGNVGRLYNRIIVRSSNNLEIKTILLNETEKECSDFFDLIVKEEQD